MTMLLLELGKPLNHVIGCTPPVRYATTAQRLIPGPGNGGSGLTFHGPFA